MRRIQHMAAKLILNSSRYESTSEARRLLYWLPIKYKCEFKIACLVLKALHGDGPSYLSDLLVPANRTWSHHKDCMS